MELLKKGETCVNGRNKQQFCLCRDPAYSAGVNLQNAFGGVFARSEQEDAWMRFAFLLNDYLEIPLTTLDFWIKKKKDWFLLQKSINIKLVLWSTMHKHVFIGIMILTVNIISWKSFCQWEQHVIVNIDCKDYKQELMHYYLLIQKLRLSLYVHYAEPFTESKSNSSKV